MRHNDCSKNHRMTSKNRIVGGRRPKITRQTFFPIRFNPLACGIGNCWLWANNLLLLQLLLIRER